MQHKSVISNIDQVHTLNDVWRQIPNHYIPEVACIYDKDYDYDLRYMDIWSTNDTFSYRIEDNFVTMTEKRASSIHLTPIFNSDFYKNKIIRCKMIACSIVIGFSNKCKLPDSELIFDRDCKYYCVDGFDSEIRSHSMKYWQPFKKNVRYSSDDTIILELNFVDNQIILYKNDRFICILFDNIDTNNVDYQLTVRASRKHETFEIFYCSVFEKKFSFDKRKNTTVSKCLCIQLTDFHVYMLFCLIQYRIVWKMIRLVWIGFLKNVNNDKCQLGKLPKDVIKHMMTFLK